MKKIYCFLNLLALAFTFNCYSIFEKAKVASSKEFAVKLFTCAGFDSDNVEFVRRGSPETGAGYYDTLIIIDGKKYRIICGGPGEYGNPHFHDIAELFTVIKGGCDFWTTLDNGKTWNYSLVTAGQSIEVPANVIHCLISNDKEGICMKVPDDSIRKTTFVKELAIPEKEEINAENFKKTYLEKSESLQMATDNYLNFITKIAEGANFPQMEVASKILSPNCKKILNGELFKQNREDFVNDLLDVYKKQGGWKVELKETILSPLSKTVVLRMFFTLKNSDIYTAIIILHFDSNFLITEINEVLNQVKGSYDFKDK